MNPDGISYLRIADFYKSGEWSAAVSAYWSPLYPLLLAAVSSALHPTSYWEAPAAHLLNFGCYLAAFAAFRYMLRSIASTQDSRRTEDTYLIDFRAPAEWACAHVLFLMVSLTWINLSVITPDMLVMVIVLFASGLTLRLRSETHSRVFFVLGAIASLGYLAKAVMFPLGLLLIILASWTRRNRRLSLQRFGFAIAGFIVVSAPQVIAVSKLVGHFSYGETGNDTYAREVNLAPFHWVGLPQGTGIPEHPITQVASDPDAFVYPVGEMRSSFPLWDRPAYWVSGIRPHFDCTQQRAVTLPILGLYVGATFVMLFVIVGLFFIPRVKGIESTYFPLIVTSIAAFGLYALVYAELRYLAGWLLVLFLSVISSMKFFAHVSKPVRSVLAILALLQGISLTVAAWQETDSFDIALVGAPAANEYLEIASRLQTMGIMPGSRVAVVGDAFHGYWARLGGIQIAGDVPDFADYWNASDSVRAAINEKFRLAGFKAVIANRVPRQWSGAGWRTVGVGNVYVKPLLSVR